MNVIRPLQASSHFLEMEVGRYVGTPLERQIIRELFPYGVESGKHYVGHYIIFYEIRGRYHCFFNQGFGPLRKVMDENQMIGTVLC